MLINRTRLFISFSLLLKSRQHSLTSIKVINVAKLCVLKKSVPNSEAYGSDCMKTKAACQGVNDEIMQIMLNPCNIYFHFIFLFSSTVKATTQG